MSKYIVDIHGEIEGDYEIIGKYQEPKTDVLDKIKAEIESLSNANPSYWHTCDVVEREDVLDIIDKYRAESEE